MSFEKKKAAALAAVMNYIKHEEEAAAAQMQAAMIDQSAYQAEPDSRVSINTWGTSGRSAQMQMRNIMQLKGFHKFR